MGAAQGACWPGSAAQRPAITPPHTAPPSPGLHSPHSCSTHAPPSPLAAARRETYIRKDLLPAVSYPLHPNTVPAWAVPLLAIPVPIAACALLVLLGKVRSRAAPGRAGASLATREPAAAGQALPPPPACNAARPGLPAVPPGGSSLQRPRGGARSGAALRREARLYASAPGAGQHAAAPLLLPFGPSPRGPSSTCERSPAPAPPLDKQPPSPPTPRPHPPTHPPSPTPHPPPSNAGPPAGALGRAAHPGAGRGHRGAADGRHHQLHQVPGWPPEARLCGALLARRPPGLEQRGPVRRLCRLQRRGSAGQGGPQVVPQRCVGLCRVVCGGWAGEGRPLLCAPLTSAVPRPAACTWVVRPPSEPYGRWRALPPRCRWRGERRAAPRSRVAGRWLRPAGERHRRPLRLPYKGGPLLRPLQATAAGRARAWATSASCSLPSCAPLTAMASPGAWWPPCRRCSWRSPWAPELPPLPALAPRCGLPACHGQRAACRGRGRPPPRQLLQQASMAARGAEEPAGSSLQSPLPLPRRPRGWP
jgi:hypothetical protein